MIVFCTHCWTETTSDKTACPHCGANLTLDPRSFETKLISALDHPLPVTRARICWLVGRNHVEGAVEKLMELVRSDPDMFVRRAAVEALGHLSSPTIKDFLQSLVVQENPWLRRTIQDSLRHLQRDR